MNLVITLNKQFLCIGVNTIQSSDIFGKQDETFIGNINAVLQIGSYILLEKY